MSQLLACIWHGQRGLLDPETGAFRPVLWGAKGGATVAPPSPDEQNLQRTQSANIQYQTDLARKQQAENEALAPYLYSQMGLSRNVDASGNISFSKMEQPLSPEDQQAAEIRDLANKRELSALKGELPVDPAVEQDLTRGQDQLKTQLLQKLGPGAEGSDAWNRAMQEFNRSATAIRYGVRTDQMTTADALATNRTNQMMQKQNQVLNNLKGATDPYSQSIASLATGANSANAGLGRMQQERFSAADLAQQGSSNRNAFWGNIIQGGMKAAGTGAGIAAFGMCWIAEVLYGEHAYETALLRYWLNAVWAPRSWVGRQVMRLYQWKGQAVARVLVAHPRWQRWVKPLFDRALRRAEREVVYANR